MKGSMSKPTAGQRGSALLLVLASLSIGSLIITPTINYVYTGISRADIAEDYILDQYAADGALELVLWQIKYDPDDLLDGLTADNPSETSTTVNDIDVPIVIEITESPLGEDWPFPVPASEAGIHLMTILVLGPPIPSEDGQTTFFPHRVYVFNSGASRIHLKEVFQQLDPRLTYVPDSWDGPDADFSQAYVDDHWELLFSFPNPQPRLDAGEATFFNFMTETTGELDEDSYVGSGWVSYAAFGAPLEEVFVGEYEPGSINARFDITISAGSYTILASVGITEDGEIVILSYQIL